MLTFSDDRIIRLLKHFIPVAYDRHKAQDRPRNGFFWKVVTQRPLLRSRDWSIESFPAAQGCYTFDGDGTTYAKLNDHASVIVDVLKQTKQEFQKQRSKRPRNDDLPVSTQLAAPKGTLIARAYSRITPQPKGCNSLNLALGRDLIWIPRQEVDTLLQGSFPETLRRRLTLAHLRDNVRGEPGQWDPEHVRLATFRADAKKSSHEIRVALSGEFRISAPHGNRGRENYWVGSAGYEGTIRGELTYDTQTQKVTRFVMYVDGQAWGEVEFTPDAPQEKFPLNIAFVLAGENDETAKVTPPYGADQEGRYLREGLPSR